MMQTYQGHFLDDGRFFADGLFVKLPTKKRAIIKFLDDDVAVVDADRQKKIVAFDTFINDAREAEGELTDADWDELINLRAKTNAGLSRKVEL